MNIALTGDVMLGRLVDQYVIQDSAVEPSSLWGDVLPFLLTADCRVANLECVISARGQPWRPGSKAFHFRAQPRAVEFLRAGRIDCVTLANNHVLDYGQEAMLECLALLDKAGIKRAGAGGTLSEASAPAFLDLPGLRLAVISLTDNEPEWEAGIHRPGVNYVDMGSQGLPEPYRSRLGKVIAQARRQAQFVIVGAHVGPNWGEPSPGMRTLAHEIIDLGADLYWGHSNHAPQAIETYKSKVILYSTGDFVDDYAVDPAERNDLSFLFVLNVERTKVERVRLHPVRIEQFRVRRAKGKEVRFLEQTMQAKCAAFRTTIHFQDGVGTIAIA